MKVLALLLPLCGLAACASLYGTQTFEVVSEYSLPAVGHVPGTQTISAQASTNTRSFAESILKNLDHLRDNDHVDSADVTIRLTSARLDVDNTFAGVKAVRVQLVTQTDSVELCNRNLSADEMRSSSISCGLDHEVSEADLERDSDTTAPARITVQLTVSGVVTATHLTSSVGFEVDVNADVSL